METPREKIVTIIERLGITNKKAAEVMMLSENTFSKSRAGVLSFSQQNYDDLVDFLILELKFIITKKLAESDENIYNIIIEKVNDLIINKNKFAKQEGWHLFDELVKVVDSMENYDFFRDMEKYDEMIEDITSISSEVFSFEKYYDYVQSDKKNDHHRWFDYRSWRRNRTINAILNS